MKKITFVITAAMLVVTTLGTINAQSKLRLPFKKAATAESSDFELTANSGPWLIMCASFSGETADRQARRLASELRDQYRLDAYIYRHKFDFNDTLPKEGLAWELVDSEDQSGKQLVKQRMKPAGQAEFEEIAVLVGDFPSVEDGRAQETKQLIKSIQPQSLTGFDAKTASDDNALAGQRLRSWRDNLDRLKNSTTADSRASGPMRSAFLLTNPMLPDEYFDRQNVDHFVMKLNQPVKHSLLKNPGLYTVRVASYRGDATFDVDKIEVQQKEMSWLRKNRKAVRTSKLAEAADKAHQLTEAFRKKGVDAYEFHDRQESYVCIGEFDWVAREDSTGNRVQNPAVVALIQKYKGTVQDLPNMPGVVVPFVLPEFANTGIVCDVQPMPVMVPKASEESVSTASKLFKRFK